MFSETKIVSWWRLFGRALKGDTLDYTTGSIDRAIFLLSVPMILEMAMESLFAVVDAFFVSRLGIAAVATVGLTESLLTIVYSVAWGLSMGTTALVARRVGEKDPAAAAAAGMQAIYLAVFLSFVVSTTGLAFAGDLLRLMGASDAVAGGGLGYTRWMLGGNVTILLIFLINAVFRGAGDASLAMRTLFLANILNMTLDPVFIFGWGPVPAFGVEGAAIATNIGRGIGVAYQVVHLVKGKGLIKPTLSSLGLQWRVIRKLVNLSAGGTGQFIIGSASWIFLMRIMASFGDAALAGYTIAIRVIVFTILPSWGMANAAATLVGQNLGARQPDRAEQSVWKSARYNMIFLGAVSVLFLCSARWIVGLFATDPEAVRNGMNCLRIVSLGYMFFAYGMVLGQALNGAGDTRTPTYLNLLGYWLIQIPLAYAVAVVGGHGPNGVFATIAFSESVVAVLFIAVFRRGAWKEVRV